MSSSLAESVEPYSSQEHGARTVWALAWPAVALSSLQVINTLLDRTFIGHLPSSALTGQGAAMNVVFLMFSLAMALGSSATALVSRAFGAGNRDEVKHASRQSLKVALISGLILGLATAAIAAATAHALLPPSDQDAIRMMTHYLIAYSIGLPGICVIQVLAGSLRGVGDTRSPMVISGIQILLHIALNLVLIFPSRVVGSVWIPGLDLGLTGAALALSISATISAAMYIAYAGRTPIGSAFSFGLPAMDWFRRILRIAIPASAMAVLRVASLTAFTMILKFVPNASSAMAAMSVGFGIESIMFMPAFGLSMAAASLVGQSLGAKRPDRAERLGWIAGHHGALVTAAAAILIFLTAPWLAGIMVEGKPEIVYETTVLLRALCVTEFLFGYAIVLFGAMQGAGDTVNPMWISAICLWGLRVPASYLLALTFDMGSLGGWIALSATQGIQGILAIWVFRRGAWKLKKV